MSLEMKLQEGDLILVKGKRYISKIIQKATDSEYSHVAVYVGDGYVIDSDWGGVQLRALEKFKEWDAYRHTEASNHEKYLAIQWMSTQIGAGYDYSGLLGIGLHLIGLTKGNPFDDKSKYWCSELVADAFINVGVPICAEENTWKVSPKDLASCEHMRLVYEHR